MSKMRMLACFISFLMATSLPASDWRMCGYIGDSKPPELLFFDASSITITNNVAHIWTKTIRRNDLDRIFRNHKILIDTSAKKLVGGYVTDFLSLDNIKNMTKDDKDYQGELASEIADELVANMAGTPYHVTILWEIDFGTNKYAVLSVTTTSKNGGIRNSTPDFPKYEYLQPDSILANLVKILQKSYMK